MPKALELTITQIWTRAAKLRHKGLRKDGVVIPSEPDPRYLALPCRHCSAVRSTAEAFSYGTLCELCWCACQPDCGHVVRLISGNEADRHRRGPSSR